MNVITVMYSKVASIREVEIGAGHDAVWVICIPVEALRSFTVLSILVYVNTIIPENSYTYTTRCKYNRLCTQNMQ